MLRLPSSRAWHRRGLWWPHWAGPAMGKTSQLGESCSRERGRAQSVSIRTLFPVPSLCNDFHFQSPSEEEGVGLQCWTADTAIHTATYQTRFKLFFCWRAEGPHCSLAAARVNLMKKGWASVLCSCDSQQNCTKPPHDWKPKAWQRPQHNKTKNYLRKLLSGTGMWGKLSIWGSSKCCHIGCNYFFFPLGYLRHAAISFHVSMTPHRHIGALAGSSILKIDVHKTTYNLGSLYLFITFHIYDVNDVPHIFSSSCCSC